MRCHQADASVGMDRDRAAFPGLRAVHPRGRRRAGELCDPPPRRGRRPQGHPEPAASRTAPRPISRSRSIGRAARSGASPSPQAEIAATRGRARAGPTLTQRGRAAGEQIRRRCRSFTFDDARKARPPLPRLRARLSTIRGCRLSGWYCQGGADSSSAATLACALDRLTLLAAGSEPKVGALFAQAELNRSFCGQRDPILAADAQIQAALESTGEPPASRGASAAESSCHAKDSQTLSTLQRGDDVFCAPRHDRN